MPSIRPTVCQSTGAITSSCLRAPAQDELAYESQQVTWAIEACGASPELTHAVTLSSALTSKLRTRPAQTEQQPVPVLDGWRIERSGDRIIVQQMPLGAGYAAARTGDSGIAESVLYLLAETLLAAYRASQRKE